MRLFFALPLPARIRARLASLSTPALGKARWVPESQLHLTLRFVGEQEPAVADALIDAVTEARREAPWPPLALRIRGVGLFGSPRRPRVLWAAVEPLAPLAEVAGALEAAVRSVGLEASTRPFAAHVTLARFKRADTDAVTRFLRDRADFETEGFEPADVVLYQSTLGPRGAVHEAVHRWPLAPRTNGAGDPEGTAGSR
ncbi:MAG TPA: RNA 2',3'-cyclic phosphodiesterase [Sandaracinaceae bacterium LLY-WYZ-13_1]|nr:RNA 2',3'-cyclic phosphodiesterase [Sandaracinaceae bacterium LLY-WYZ-13_1]